jgi:translation initiation factor IF-3
MAHQEFGLQLMQRVKEDLSGMSQVEMEPKITGRNVTMTLSPLPANRRKRRFAEIRRPEEEEPATAEQNGAGSGASGS